MVNYGLELVSNGVHARLTGTPRALFIVDLGSSNGTKVNGNECEAGRSVPLVAGDEVRLGDQVFHLRLPDDGDGGE